MTLGELIRYLDQHSTQHYLQGNEAQTFSLAQQSLLDNSLWAEMINAIAAVNECDDENGVIVREVVVKALGPLRLKFMADDAPVDGFRFLESTIVMIDSAFNDEALAAKRRG
jgi:hypothetical protein